MIKSWKEMDLSHYKKLAELKSKEWENDLEMNIAMIAMLSDQSEEDIMNLEIKELQERIGALGFLINPYKPSTPEKSYLIGDREYQVFFNVNKMTASQYIDFQNFFKEYDNYMPNLAACFLLPKGKKYGEDYDPLEEAEYLNKHLTVDIFSDIMFFFVKLSQLSTMNSLYSLEKEMKKSLKKTKNKVERIRILRTLIQTRRLILLLKSGIELSE